MIDDTDRRALQMSGDTVYTRSGGLASPDEYVKEYNPNNVEVGVTDEGKKFSIDYSVANRILLLGIVGSGKTMTIQSIIERCYKSGKFNVVVLTDVKDEFSAMVKSAPKGQYQFYNNGEKPQSFPVISFKPTFFKHYKVKVPNQPKKFKFPLGFDINDLSYTDMYDIFGVNELPTLQKAFFFEVIEKMMSGHLKINGIETFEELIEKAPGGVLNAGSKQGLKMKLRNFFKIGFFDEPRYNIIDIMNKNYMITMNFEGFDNVSKSNGAPQIAVSMIHRIVANAKINKLLKKPKLLLVLDEANRFVPSDRDTSTKLEIISGIEVLRAYQISSFFAYQTLESVPQAVFQNSRYIMIPQSAGMSSFVEAIKSSGIYRRALNTLQTYISRLKQRMNNFTIIKDGKQANVGRYTWLVIDKMTNRADIVYFFTPMSEKSVKS